ncbi:hypothetical protein D3C77_788760 [compost metagenome]
MAADFAMGQQRQGALQRGIGVVQDNELDAVVLVDRRVATVDAQACRATGDRQQQEGNQGFFKRGKHVSSLSV